LGQTQPPNLLAVTAGLAQEAALPAGQGGESFGPIRDTGDPFKSGAGSIDTSGRAFACPRIKKMEARESRGVNQVQTLENAK
jgi:hypothetical protein